MEVYHELYCIKTNSHYHPSVNDDSTLCGANRGWCFHTGPITELSVYIANLIVGVPIFTSGGGPSYILQPTFGYLIGFMVGAYAVGRIAETMDTLSFKRLLAGSILNLFIVYGLGMVYLYFIMNLYLGKPIGVEAVIITCFLIPVGPDIFLCAVAASLGKRIIKELQH